MRDIGGFNGRAFPHTGKRTGHPTPSHGTAGAMKAAPADPGDRSKHVTRALPPERSVPVNSFEGFGSFSG